MLHLVTNTSNTDKEEFELLQDAKDYIQSEIAFFNATGDSYDESDFIIHSYLDSGESVQLTGTVKYQAIHGATADEVIEIYEVQYKDGSIGWEHD